MSVIILYFREITRTECVILVVANIPVLNIGLMQRIKAVAECKQAALCVLNSWAQGWVSEAPGRLEPLEQSGLQSQIQTEFTLPSHILKLSMPSNDRRLQSTVMSTYP